MKELSIWFEYFLKMDLSMGIATQHGCIETKYDREGETEYDLFHETLQTNIVNVQQTQIPSTVDSDTQFNGPHIRTVFPVHPDHFTWYTDHVIHSNLCNLDFIIKTSHPANHDGQIAADLLGSPTL